MAGGHDLAIGAESFHFALWRPDGVGVGPALTIADRAYAPKPGAPARPAIVREACQQLAGERRTLEKRYLHKIANTTYRYAAFPAIFLIFILLRRFAPLQLGGFFPVAASVFQIQSVFVPTHEPVFIRWPFRSNHPAYLRGKMRHLLCPQSVVNGFLAGIILKRN